MSSSLATRPHPISTPSARVSNRQTLVQKDPPLSNKTRRDYLLCLRRLLDDCADNGHTIQPRTHSSSFEDSQNNVGLQLVTGSKLEPEAVIK
jgi:hypothetical protein